MIPRVMVKPRFGGQFRSVHNVASSVASVVRFSLVEGKDVGDLRKDSALGTPSVLHQDAAVTSEQLLEVELIRIIVQPQPVLKMLE